MNKRNEQKTSSAPDTTPPAVDANGRPLTRTVEVAEGPNTGVHLDQAAQAHAQPTDAFITNPDGSKSVAFAEPPQRREEN